jgi:hypothetical protein
LIDNNTTILTPGSLYFCALNAVINARASSDSDSIIPVCSVRVLIDLPFEQPHERRLHRGERAHLLGDAIDSGESSKRRTLVH